MSAGLFKCRVLEDCEVDKNWILSNSNDIKMEYVQGIRGRKSIKLTRLQSDVSPSIKLEMKPILRLESNGFNIPLIKFRSNCSLGFKLIEPVLGYFYYGCTPRESNQNELFLIPVGSEDLTLDYKWLELSIGYDLGSPPSLKKDDYIIFDDIIIFEGTEPLADFIHSPKAFESSIKVCTPSTSIINAFYNVQDIIGSTSRTFRLSQSPAGFSRDGLTLLKNVLKPQIERLAFVKSVLLYFEYGNLAIPTYSNLQSSYSYAWKDYWNSVFPVIVSDLRISEEGGRINQFDYDIEMLEYTLPY